MKMIHDDLKMYTCLTFATYTSGHKCDFVDEAHSGFCSTHHSPDLHLRHREYYIPEFTVVYEEYYEIVNKEDPAALSEYGKARAAHIKAAYKVSVRDIRHGRCYT